MAVPPDNRCCFCCTLRGGVILIAVLDILFYMISYITYGRTVYGKEGWSMNELNNLDISIFAIFIVQVLVNLLLVFAAVKKIPSHAIPWLCANSVVIGILLVLLGMLLFFGSGQMRLNYSEFCSSLAGVGLVTAVHLFCCIVVFQYRRNMIVEASIERENNSTGPAASAPPSQHSGAPPPYDEVSKEEQHKLPMDVEQPPEYDAAMSMLANCTDSQICSEDNEKLGTSNVIRRKVSF